MLLLVLITFSISKYVLSVFSDSWSERCWKQTSDLYLILKCYFKMCLWFNVVSYFLVLSLHMSSSLCYFTVNSIRRFIKVFFIQTLKCSCEKWIRLKSFFLFLFGASDVMTDIILHCVRQQVTLYVHIFTSVALWSWGEQLACFSLWGSAEAESRFLAELPPVILQRVLQRRQTQPAFAVLEGETFQGCINLTFRVFPGCVTRCFTLTNVYQFPFFLSTLSGVQRILGHVRPRRIVASKNREKKEHLEEPSDWDRLHVALWRSWPSDAPLKDAELNWDSECDEHNRVYMCIRDVVLSVDRWSMMTTECFQSSCFYWPCQIDTINQSINQSINPASRIHSDTQLQQVQTPTCSTTPPAQCKCFRHSNQVSMTQQLFLFDSFLGF